MGIVLVIVVLLILMEPFCLENETDVAEYGIFNREVDAALDAITNPDSFHPNKGINRWRWAFQKIMKKDQWDPICNFAVRAVHNKQNRKRMRLIGDARTLRYVVCLCV